MLLSQRSLFAIPRNVCYLNAASMTPLPHAVIDAGTSGAAHKGQPWRLDADSMARTSGRARGAAAQLINALPSDIALISSVSYGVATAAKILDIPQGTRVLVLAGDHASPVLEWMMRAPLQNFTVEAVQNKGEDWTGSLLESIERRDAPPVSLASISSVHWSDGSVVHLEPVCARIRAQGGAVLIDATQSAGVLALDVQKLDPDFVVFPCYKWLLGPYGRAFLYVAKRWQSGVPLEQSAAGRKGIDAEKPRYIDDLDFREGASRFDMGERDFLITMGMASTGVEMMLAWGASAVAARLENLTGRLLKGLAGLTGIQKQAAKTRAPHILSLGLEGGVPGSFVKALAAREVYIAQRLGNLRISPHVYNDEEDIDRFVDAFASCYANSS